MLPPWSCQCSWDFSSRDLIPVYVRYFQPLWRSWSVISSAIMEIMVLCISSSWRFWSMYIVRGYDHICDIMHYAYSWPLYFYVSSTAICICSHMQRLIIGLYWWMAGSSSLHFWDGFYNVFRPSCYPSDLTPGRSHIYGLPCPSADSLDPMDLYYTLMFQVHP